MEEILASIKRVIAEEGRSAVRKTRERIDNKETEIEPAPTAPDEDVLELDQPVSEDPLLSQEKVEASRQSLATLASLRQMNDPAGSGARSGEGALESIVRDMLRPMLKEWLDEHLPTIIEELVSREIARLTSGKE